MMNWGFIMEISSAFNSGVQGLQNASAAAQEAALDIATSVTPIAEQQSSDNTNSDLSSARTANTIPDINQAVVDLKVAEYQAKASTEVIKSADETLGTLLDVTA